MFRFPLLGLVLAALLAVPASAQTCTDGVQTSGALYEFCVPPGPPAPYLVLYAHGYIFPQQPLTLPSSSPTTAGIRDLLLSQGLAYGATSYYANGLVLPDLAVEDLREVVDLYTAAHGAPERVYLIGFSNGALISTVALENFPDEFDGALASCGPLDSYTNNVDYFGDIFVVLDHFIPGVLDMQFGVEAGTPGAITDAYFTALVTAATQAGVSPVELLAGYLQGVLSDPANATAVGQILGVLAVTPGIQAAFNDPVEGSTTIISAMAFNVFAGNQAAAVLGGNPYGNATRMYASPFGPVFDAALNASIARYTPDEEAREDLDEAFETTGDLMDPLVALHTTRDGVVPYWQSDRYEARTNALYFDLRPVERYGHCAFTPEEIAQGFFTDLLGSRTLACSTVFEADPVGSTTVGSGGGRVSFAFGIDNSAGATDETLDVWVTVRDQDGNVLRIQNRRTVTVGAGAKAVYSLAQRVPAGLPDGAYTYTIAVGDFDETNPAASSICGYETFSITKGTLAPLSIGAPFAVSAEKGAVVWPTPEIEEVRTETTSGDLLVAPNPTTGEVRFSFVLDAPADVTLRVFDVRGREIATVAEGRFGEGAHDLALDYALTPGVYVWRLAVGADVQTGRITVVR